MLTISQNCLDLIKKWEGFVPIAKPCPAGYPTFGYGSIRRADGRKDAAFEARLHR